MNTNTYTRKRNGFLAHYRLIDIDYEVVEVGAEYLLCRPDAHYILIPTVIRTDLCELTF
ncbi:hypothetical protein Amme_245_001 [Acidomonas methanolica NBRC 104435]|uniref:Uncharacterized protein n=1 Tax=Acidomonas methanolica NBRC 104435 TaxID=1231351 RepID=A0A023D999_ACIMT|nr:hypothetical protein Amme_245_001 [Acidomonas methanolica NBRC 104435]